MKTVIKEGVVEAGGQIYRWRYDSQSGYFSLSSLDEDRIVVKTISLQNFEAQRVEKLIEQELVNIGKLQRNTPPKFTAPKVTFTRIEKKAQSAYLALSQLPLESLWAELRTALKLENYESAILYRNELIKRGQL